MISESLKVTPLKTGAETPSQQSSQISFEPQSYDIIHENNVTVIKFYGELSSGMELFLEREKKFEEKKKKIETESESEEIPPHYSLPIITTASASVPVYVEVADPIV